MVSSAPRATAANPRSKPRSIQESTTNMQEPQITGQQANRVEQNIVSHFVDEAPSSATILLDAADVMLVGTPVLDFSLEPNLPNSASGPQSTILREDEQARDGDISHMQMDFEIPDLDFFDPFLGSAYGQFSLPILAGNNDFASSLEQSSQSDRASNTGSEHALYPENQPRSNLRLSQPSISGLTCPAQPPLHPKYSRVAEATAQLSENVRRTTAKQRGLRFTERARTNLWNDLCSRLDIEKIGVFELPTATTLQKWLRTYLEAFHVHFPFIHFPSLDLEATPSPLILAICAVGALYRLERAGAVSLHVKAVQCLSVAEVSMTQIILRNRLLEHWSPPKSTPDPSTARPLWHSQARLLTLMFAAFSGDPAVVVKSIEDLGHLSSVRS